MNGVLSLTVLGSGSAGNCSLVATDSCRFLVDVGLSARQICQRLQSVGVRPESLDGIVITHEHGDHVAGLEVFTRRFKIPLYCNRDTAEALVYGGYVNQPTFKKFETGSPFLIKNVEIQSFYVPHDAVDPVAFVFASNEGAIGFLTDLGHAPKHALERIRQVHTLVVETNHDERMLQEDAKRPWSVKQRILSRHGHLSNEAAAKVVAEIAGDRLRRVVLGHLSRECNRPELAQAAMVRLGLNTLDLFCAAQHEVSPTFIVESSPALMVREQVEPVRHDRNHKDSSQATFDLGWQGPESDPRQFE
ncbi:MAG: MBL fold metallo-hydrolase [Chthoniobacterales bacterium]